MQATLNRLRYAFLGLFALGVVGVWTYQIVWAMPRERCEKSHRWWSNEDRQCATPVSVSTFTGRPNPATAHPNPGVVQ